MGSSKIEMVWVDLETTGLNFDTDQILEIGMIGTDRWGGNPVIIAEELILPHGSWETWKLLMDDVVKEMHTGSGLIADLDGAATDPAYRSPLEIESQILRELERLGLESGEYEMCGNTIGFDRMMLFRHMPNLYNWFHYRNLDVSTLKNACRRLNPSVFSQAPEKSKVHRVLQDIRESIEEYQYYLDEFLLVSDVE